MSTTGWGSLTRQRRALFASAALVGLVAVAVGCARRGEAERNDGGDEVVVRDRDGRETRVRVGAATIPAEFPPGVPLYPGTSVSSTGRTTTSVVVGLTPAAATPDAVRSFYLAQPGYELVSDQQVGDSRVLRLKHAASGKDFQVTVRPQGSKTDVALVAPL